MGTMTGVRKSGAEGENWSGGGGRALGPFIGPEDGRGGGARKGNDQ
jgi:hypothetical protein